MYKLTDYEGYAEGLHLEGGLNVCTVPWNAELRQPGGIHMLGTLNAAIVAAHADLAYWVWDARPVGVLVACDSVFVKAHAVYLSNPRRVGHFILQTMQPQPEHAVSDIPPLDYGECTLRAPVRSNACHNLHALALVALSVPQHKRKLNAIYVA